MFCARPRNDCPICPPYLVAGYGWRMAQGGKLMKRVKSTKALTSGLAHVGAIRLPSSGDVVSAGVGCGATV